ncbi:hypothetical protein BH24DEI2_BH24DEI2_28140 [soil metagenome]
MNPPRICLVTDSLQPSGLGVHMLTLAGALVGRYDVLFVMPEEAGGTWLEQAHALGCEPLCWNMQRESLSEALTARDIKLAHVHAGIGWEGHEAVYGAKTAGARTVRTEHLPYLITDEGQKAEYQDLTSVVDRFIFVSKSAADSHVAAGVPWEKARVVPNGILEPRTKQTRETVRARLGLTVDAPLVLTAGRFTEQKGHRYLLEAVAQVLVDLPIAVFALVGGGPLEPELKAQADALGVGDNVLFLGRRDDVPDLLGASDLFTLSSLFEGLPLVVLEALALGVPVVGTNVCGIRDAIQDGVTGRLVAPKDSGALAAGLLEALCQPEMRQRWAEAGRARFHACHRAERMAADTRSVYEQLLAGEAGL